MNEYRVRESTDQQGNQESGLMFDKVRMRALGAIKEIFSLVSFRFGVRRVAIWVLHFCNLAEVVDANGMPMGDEGGQGSCGNDVAV